MTEPPGRALPAPVERVTAIVFRWVAASRRAPALHPAGRTYVGLARLSDRGSVLAAKRELAAVVRLSRGIGWSQRLPDFNGVAVRLVDAHGEGRHQDLLMTSAGRAPLARHVLWPTRWFSSRGFSTVLPYTARAADGSDEHAVLFRCEPLALGALDEIDERLDDGAPLTVSISVARPLGPWETAAEVQLARRADTPALRFDPWNTGPQLEPRGLLNRLRRPAYRGSRAGSAAIRRAR